MPSSCSLLSKFSVGAKPLPSLGLLAYHSPVAQPIVPCQNRIGAPARDRRAPCGRGAVRDSCGLPSRRRGRKPRKRGLRRQGVRAEQRVSDLLEQVQPAQCQHTGLIGERRILDRPEGRSAKY